MRNKAIKIIVLFIITVIIISINSIVFGLDIDDPRSPAYRAPTQTTTKISPIENPDAFKPSQEGENSEVVTNMLSVVLGVIKTIGTLVSVGILMVIGIKYMVGSVEERAGYKKTMIPYLIGALFIFATPQIVSAIYEIMQNI